ncbi:FAD-dependent oxidoreductase [Rudanella paleaurantiibacter]|nr:FAD-dependent oxidoreductase [Rudanella paleaurantiibacter]
MKPNRRTFLTQTALGVAALATAPLLPGCRTAQAIPGQTLGPNHRAGHWLRGPLPDLTHTAPAETHSAEVVIVGGGIAGLSARRWLAKAGITDVLLLELEEKTGGNSAAGQNSVSAYPWGAHYLPIPDIRNRELLDFLAEAGSITGYNQAGLPLYNEYHLCHDPEERLFINGHWQEGLVPEIGVPTRDRDQIRRFFAEIETLRQAVGTDGRDAFAIPLDHSSADARYRNLDMQSFADYLTQKGFTSPYLRWYLNYCCQDDYGISLEQTSAWAGLHYFAGRKGRAANAPGSAVLTWPEGNAFLADQLRQQAETPTCTNTLAFSLEQTETGVRVLARDLARNRTVAINARTAILATPAFITRRLLGKAAPAAAPQPLTHTPWVVANLTVDALPQGPGVPLCWDNVVYGTDSVGYISANHQHLHDSPQRVITFYKPLTGHTSAQVSEARKRAYGTTREEWITEILAELETAHPSISQHVQEIDIWVWGHGMAAPAVGALWHSNRTVQSQPIGHSIYFAHTDYSGISIFEEAFYSGIRSAQAILANRQSTAL